MGSCNDRGARSSLRRHGSDVVRHLPPLQFVARAVVAPPDGPLAPDDNGALAKLGRTVIALRSAGEPPCAWPCCPVEQTGGHIHGAQRHRPACARSAHSASPGVSHPGVPRRRRFGRLSRQLWLVFVHVLETSAPPWPSAGLRGFRRVDPRLSRDECLAATTALVAEGGWVCVPSGLPVAYPRPTRLRGGRKRGDCAV